MSSLKQKTFNNVSFSAITRIVAFFFQALANIILSRTLLSGDYGLVGFANIFINFLAQFSDLGVNSAVIQRKDLDEKALYTGFTMKLGVGLGIYLLAIMGSGLAVLFFDNHAVVNVIKVLALNFLINSFAFLPTSLLKRGLDYKKISIANICQTIFNSSLAIILALAGFKYWSIVLANLVATLAMVVALNILKPVKIRFAFDKNIAREFMTFGSSLTFSLFIGFVIFNLDNFIIGAVRGSSELGYYMIAFNWGSIICLILGSVVNNVLFPTFSRMDGDKERIKRAYLKILEYVSFIGIMANTLLLLMSRDFLVQLLGHGSDKWLPALQSLRILAVYGIIRLLLEPVANVFMSLGLTKIILRTTAISALLEVVLLYPALKLYGLEGVALLITITYVSQYAIYMPALRRILNISYGELFTAIKQSIYPALFIIIFGIVLNIYIVENAMLYFVFKVIVLGTAYLIIYGAINGWKFVKEAKEMMVGVRG